MSLLCFTHSNEKDVGNEVLRGGISILDILKWHLNNKQRIPPQSNFCMKKYGSSALAEGPVNAAWCFYASVLPSVTAFSQDWLISFSEFLHEVRVST